MSTMMSWIDAGHLGDCATVRVEYDYQPREPVTREHPGCDEDATVTAVYLIGWRSTVVDVPLDVIHADAMERFRLEALEEKMAEREAAAEQQAAAAEYASRWEEELE